MFLVTYINTRLVAMTFFDFVEKYCEKYQLKLVATDEGKRLAGIRLISIKLLVYIIRVYFNSPSYQIIANSLTISRQSAMLFYYDILSKAMYRKIAEDRYKEIMNAKTTRII